MPTTFTSVAMVLALDRCRASAGPRAQSPSPPLQLDPAARDGRGKKGT